MKCSICHKELDEDYFTLPNNSHQRSCFDDADDNISAVCSDACFQEALSVYRGIRKSKDVVCNIDEGENIHESDNQINPESDF